MDFKIREIEPNDNKHIAAVIRSVFIELDAPKEGTAYADTTLNTLFEAYNKPGAAYFVVEDGDGNIVGGAGISVLEGEDDTVCELQKMYFLPQARNTGTGALMMEKCITTAKKFGYRQCYLETLTDMKAAQKLYLKSGFTYINAPMGATGHTNCPVWMIKNLI